MVAQISKILLVEDTPSLARLYVEYLKGEPVEIVTAQTGAEALAEIERQTPDIILLDLNLPDMKGMDILRFAVGKGLRSSVIVITANGSINVAVEAMRAGAYDFIVKPFAAERLLVTVRNAAERQRLARMVKTYEMDFVRDGYGGFVGTSLAMQAVYRIIDTAAKSKATVFITGESGTGKEVCAEEVHRHSPRRNKSFVALNCAAIPKDLIESEIFGHAKGAFTGATSDRKGAASQADGGTLFLDEICEMQIDLQTKLLRFIQTGTFQRVGDSHVEKVDIRFICATNRDPWKEVEAGRFREDLYYRLHVIPIQLPPLRERDDDVVMIARHFLTRFTEEEGKTFSEISPEAEAILAAYHWPGNVRQLQNVIRSVVVLNDRTIVLPEMLPAPPRVTAASAGAPSAATRKEPDKPAVEERTGGELREVRIVPLWQVEREAIERAIASCDGNIPKAAAALEISPSTIYRKQQTWQAEGVN